MAQELTAHHVHALARCVSLVDSGPPSGDPTLLFRARSALHILEGLLADQRITNGWRERQGKVTDRRAVPSGQREDM